MEQEKTYTLTFTESEMRLLWSCVYSRRAEIAGADRSEGDGVLRQRLSDLSNKVDHTRYPDKEQSA